MRPWIIIAALFLANEVQAANIGAIAGAAAQGAAAVGMAVLEPAPPKPGLKPEDSRNGGDGIKVLRPTQYDWDRYFEAKGYINNQPDRSVLTTESRSNK